MLVSDVNGHYFERLDINQSISGSLYVDQDKWCYLLGVPAVQMASDYQNATARQNTYTGWE